MKKFMKEWRIAFVVAILIGTMGGTVLAAGVSGPYNANPDKYMRITWDVLNSVTNSTAYSNPNGKTGNIDCTIVAAGTNTMSIWPQTSANGSAFVNAISTAWDVTPGNSETLHFFGNVKGGDQWRLHTEDSDVDVTNTVTMFCDFWR